MIRFRQAYWVRMMAQKSYRGLAVESFKKANGPVLGAAGIVIGLAAWHFAAGIPFPNWVLVDVIVFSWLLVTFFGFLSLDLYDLIRGGLPAVVRFMTIAQGQGDITLCLLGESNLFSADTFACFYYRMDGGFEVLIGYGFVINIQDDQRIQVSLDEKLPGYDNVWNTLINNDAEALKKVLVKPNASRQLFDRLGIWGVPNDEP